MALVSDILTEVRYEIKDVAETAVTDAELIGYFNEAVRKIVTRVCRDWPDYWMYTGEAYQEQTNLVAGTAHYDLPADFYMMLFVTLKNAAGDLTEQEPINLRRSLDADENNGYMLIDNDIYLYPTPDTNVANGLTVWYVALPTTITAVGDTAPLTTHFWDALREYIVLKYKARQEEKLDHFATFYRMVEEDAAPIVERTNRSADRHGMNMVARNWR